jgi:hypothetical protein
MVSTRSRSNSVSAAVSDSPVVVDHINTRKPIIGSTTTTSSSKIHHSKVDEIKIKSPHGEDNDDNVNDDKVTTSNNSSSRRSSNMKSKKNNTITKKKKELERQLRMKSTGIGIQIIPIKTNTSTLNNHNDDHDDHDDDTESITTIAPTKPINRKIVFTDVDEIMDYNDNSNYDDDITLDISNKKKDHSNNEGNEMDDGDNDNVEEMMTSTAKDQLRIETLHQRMAQKSSITTQQHIKRKRKKRSITKNLEKSNNSNDNNNNNTLTMDENDFQQLEQEQKQIKKQKSKQLLSNNDDNISTNTTTKTFTINKETNELQPFDGTTPTNTKKNVSNNCNLDTTKINNNIQVVVLNHTKQQQQRPIIDHRHHLEEPSMTDKLQYYSRYGYIDPNNRSNNIVRHNTNSTTMNTTKLRKQEQKKQQQSVVSTWKRSKQMNRIVSVSSRLRQKGTTAAIFCTKRK